MPIIRENSSDDDTMALFVRTIGIVRATVKIGMANLTYNLRRFVWHQGRTAPA